MTTYYVDPVNGNDANDGLGWGTAWKTLLNGPTSARLGQTDADEVRVAKSPDPVSIGNVTWTQDSDTITFSGCSNITVDNCNTAWTAGLVTPTATTSYYREGTASAQAIMASTKGKVCYKTITTANYSAHTRLTFWVNFATAVNYSASSPITLTLCSDTTGSTPVVTFTLPRLYYPANYWVPITVTPSSGDMTSATGIQSIALNTTSAVSNTIRLDNISVAKDYSDATSLVLTDLIAKDNSAKAYYTICAINGTTIKMTTIASGQATAPASSPTNYYSLTGATETVASIKRACTSTALDVIASASTTAVCAINYTNDANYPATKTYTGGWNTSTNTVDGETWFDGVTGYGYGLTQTNSYTASWSIDRMSAVRYDRGFIANVGSNVDVTNCNLVGNKASYELVDSTTLYGVYYQRTGTALAFPWIHQPSVSGSGTIWGVQSLSAPLEDRDAGIFPRLTIGNVHVSAGSIVSRRGDLTITGTYISCSGTSLAVPPWGVTSINNLTSYHTGAITLISVTGPGPTAVYSPLTVAVSGVVSAQKMPAYAVATFIDPPAGEYVRIIGTNPGTSEINVVLPNAILALSATPYPRAQLYVKDIKFTSNYLDGLSQSSYVPSKFVFDNYKNTAGDFRIYNWMSNSADTAARAKGFWTKNAGVKYAGAFSWQRRCVDGSGGTGGLWDKLSCGDVAVKAGSQVTITTRVYRGTYGTDVACSLIVLGDGVYAPRSSSAYSSIGSTNLNTWETLTVQLTPTVNTVLNIQFGYNNTAGPTTNQEPLVYFDDLQVTQV